MWHKWILQFHKYSLSGGVFLAYLSLDLGNHLCLVVYVRLINSWRTNSCFFSTNTERTSSIDWIFKVECVSCCGGKGREHSYGKRGSGCQQTIVEPSSVTVICSSNFRDEDACRSDLNTFPACGTAFVIPDLDLNNLNAMF